MKSTLSLDWNITIANFYKFTTDRKKKRDIIVKDFI